MEAVLLASVTFIGAEVARKVADGAMCKAWDSFLSAWSARFGKAPTANDVTVESLELMSSSADWIDEFTDALEDSALMNRVRRVGDSLRGINILWIDDHPEWNVWEVSFFEAAGARVRTVETTRSALALAGNGFDVFISDIDRGGDPVAGLAALPELRTIAPGSPVVFYVGDTTGYGVPAGAFGMADRPDGLIHLVLDAAERRG